MAENSYIVVAPHAEDECLASLDYIAWQGAEALARWRWGCKFGLHVGYGLIEAASDEEARAAVPELIRARALVAKVSLFTMENMRTAHEVD
jgi:hypothetical protein